MADDPKELSPEIPESATLWRLIHKTWVHKDSNPDQNRYRPESLAFKPKSGRISVCIADEILADGLSPADFLNTVKDHFPDSGIASISVSQVKALGIKVVRSFSEIIPAHAELVVPKVPKSKSKKIKSDLAKASVWVVAPPGYETKIVIGS